MTTAIADFLLIDIGNTTVKLRLASPTRLVGRTRRLPTAGLTTANLQKTLADWRYARTVLSSVVPDVARTVARTIPDTLTVSPSLDTGVDLRGYLGVRTLGADRIANAAGAWALHSPGPLIVVDFGTAATFNALDAHGRFLGGIIAPGLAAMTNYLSARTAQLPPVRLTGATPAAIGRNTRGALRAGAILGYRGLIRELLKALRTELAAGKGQAPRIIATGGDAAWVAKGLPDAFDAVDPELTLQGLRIIGARSGYAHATHKKPLGQNTRSDGEVD